MGHISWFTPPLSHNQGYGIAAIETIRALQRNGLNVSWNIEDTYVHINFIQPPMYGGTEAQYKIGYTPWESTKVPYGWKLNVDKMQEMWTTSTFCKEVYEAEGLAENVHVFPHGIDPDLFKITDRERSERFIFFHMGGPTGRKGGEMVSKAFIECFNKRDDVYLLIKSHGPSEGRWLDEDGFHGNIGNHPRVQVIENNLDPEDIYRLYEISHCCVYPTSGEGFGFIPFQGIATGLPTITTNLTGTADFAEMSIPLEASWTEGEGIHEGRWAKPNYEDLCDKMIYVVDNWEKEKIKAMQSARIIHDTQTWDHVARSMIQHLGDKVEIVFGDKDE